MIKRFAVYPGTVISKNDWDRHYVGAHQLMRLYGVHPGECVIVRDEHDVLGRRQLLKRLMRLAPLSGVDYRPITEAERARYPLDSDPVIENDNGMVP